MEIARVRWAFCWLADQHPQSGGIDEVHLGEVEHEAVAPVERLVEGFLELRSGVDVEIPSDVDDLDPVNAVDG